MDSQDELEETNRVVSGGRANRSLHQEMQQANVARPRSNLDLLASMDQPRSQPLIDLESDPPPRMAEILKLRGMETIPTLDTVLNEGPLVRPRYMKNETFDQTDIGFRNLVTSIRAEGFKDMKVPKQRLIMDRFVAAKKAREQKVLDTVAGSQPSSAPFVPVTTRPVTTTLTQVTNQLKKRPLKPLPVS